MANYAQTMSDARTSKPDAPGAPGGGSGLRLGLVVDAVFRQDATNRVYAGDELLGFATFAAAVGEHFERFVLLARQGGTPAATPHALPGGVELAGLPFYPSLRDLPAVLRAVPATVKRLWKSIGDLDIVWVSASNPVGLIALLLARLRGKRTALLVRQDSMEYFRRRLPGPAWAPMLAPLYLVDLVFRRIARSAPTTAVGAEIARLYGGGRSNVLVFTVNLTRVADVDPESAEAALHRPLRLLTVGRIEPEKNPLLLVEALELLGAEESGAVAATWVGDGKLRDDLLRVAEERGVGSALTLPGFVPAGPALGSYYEAADIFVHIALTEGVPGVLGEAMGHGVPVVATDVGGIRGATRGEAAILVPPADAIALAAAVRRVRDDDSLRQRLVGASLAQARRTSVDVESVRVAAFLKEA